MCYPEEWLPCDSYFLTLIKGFLSPEIGVYRDILTPLIASSCCEKRWFGCCPSFTVWDRGITAENDLERIWRGEGLSNPVGLDRGGFGASRESSDYFFVNVPKIQSEPLLWMIIIRFLNNRTVGPVDHFQKKLTTFPEAANGDEDIADESGCANIFWTFLGFHIKQGSRNRLCGLEDSSWGLYRNVTTFNATACRCVGKLIN